LFHCYILDGFLFNLLIIYSLQTAPCHTAVTS
jgi:hypothetical protein